MNLVTLLRQRLREEQAGIAEGLCLRPPLNDVGELGLRAGKYQGLELALTVLDDILRENQAKEQSS